MADSQDRNLPCLRDERSARPAKRARWRARATWRTWRWWAAGGLLPGDPGHAAAGRLAVAHPGAPACVLMPRCWPSEDVLTHRLCRIDLGPGWRCCCRWAPWCHWPWALGAGLVVGGWNFTWKPLSPQLRQAQPASAGWATCCRAQRLGDLGKACLLALVLVHDWRLLAWLACHLPHFHRCAGHAAAGGAARTRRKRRWWAGPGPAAGGAGGVCRHRRAAGSASC